MSTLFKRATIVLTTLFVYVMPLHAATSPGDVATDVPSAGDCTTIEMLISPEARKTAEEQGVDIITLSPEQTTRVTQEFEKDFGSPPYVIEYAVILRKAEQVLLFWFDKNKCLLGNGRFSGQNVQRIFDAVEGRKL